ncbi:MAG: hypothetical protein ABF620_03460, partial [Liquorilactobacillus satsumensis]
ILVILVPLISKQRVLKRASTNRLLAHFLLLIANPLAHDFDPLFHSLCIKDKPCHHSCKHSFLIVDF